jgi:hypothetical protein
MHLVIDGLGCEPKQLSDPEHIRRFLDAYPDAISMTKITEPHVYTYRGPKPEDWGDIHHWEALGAGFTRVDGDPWWAISLFYPDPEAAAADAGEILDRMQGHETAIPHISPTMSAEGLARLPAFRRPS